MADITNKRLLWTKAILFFVLGALAAGMLLAQLPTLRSALLLTITVWAFCRAYYFAFYVIEHYIDSSYRYAGLVDFVFSRCRSK